MVSRKKISGGRANQKRRTRKEILRAADRLLARGEQPRLESVAEEAMVSRATVYRYFSSLDTLLAEAPLDVKTLDSEELFNGMSAAAAERAVRVQEHLHDLVADNEARFRHFLKATMDQWIAAGGELKEPLRGARRLGMLDAALKPIRGKLDRKTYDKLRYALAMCVSIEAFVTLTDVCRLDRKQGKDIASWAIRTLVNAVAPESRVGKATRTKPRAKT